MNKQIEILRLKKAYHRYSDCIDGVDFNLTPKELLTMYNVDNDAFHLFRQMPYSRDNAGKILVNEALPDWELLRDLLLALDRLPDSLLVDIYKMDSERYKPDELDKLDGDTTDEMLRKTLYRLIPEIIWAHSYKTN